MIEVDEYDELGPYERFSSYQLRAWDRDHDGDVDMDEEFDIEGGLR